MSDGKAEKMAELLSNVHEAGDVQTVAAWLDKEYPGLDVNTCGKVGLRSLQKLVKVTYKALLVEAAADALVWCSGSADFGPRGKARKGWLKGPRQLLDRLLALRESDKPV
jgi:hypothetical protein